MSSKILYYPFNMESAILQTEQLLRLSLWQLPRMGSSSCSRLLRCFKSAEAVFSASPEALLEACPRLNPEALSAIHHRPDTANACRIMDTCSKLNIRMLNLDEPDYPGMLAAISSPPPFLFIKGRWPLPPLSLGVVGTRTPSSYGVVVTRKLVRALAESNILIISGFARGIDTIAHKSALRSRGVTIAVMGSGLDTIYPPENESMLDQITASGAIISELPPGTPIEPKNFPLRNRIISGLSSGVLVTESGGKSGAIITCQHAFRQGRTVFAIPGSLLSRNSDGPNRLIQSGAVPVMGPEDIVRVLSAEISKRPLMSKCPENIPIPPAAGKTAMGTGPGGAGHMQGPAHRGLDHPDPVSRNICRLLGPAGLDLDKLGELTGSAPHVLLSILLNLELEGLVQRTPGSVYHLRQIKDSQWQRNSSDS